jgi:hypothetical protein
MIALVTDSGHRRSKDKTGWLPASIDYSNWFNRRWKMTDNTVTLYPDQAESLESSLERRFIAEYLFSKGYCMADLESLPDVQVRILMTAACRYAAFKLAEIEARSKFRQHIKYPHLRT